MKRQTKVFQGFTKSLDEELGVVEAYVSVYGIKDLDTPPDLIEMGAFAKSIQERGPAGANKIRVLWQHNWHEVIAVPQLVVEHPREMLPKELLEKYPEATGGLFVRVQFVLDVQRGREAYALYKAGAMDEWSIGFDVIQMEILKDAENNNYHLLKELRLWEFSPVTWGMNQATMTTDVKQAGEDVPEAEPQRAALTKAKLMAQVLKKEVELREARK